MKYSKRALVSSPFCSKYSRKGRRRRRRRMSAFASRVYVYARGTYVRPVAIESRSIPSIFASHGLSTAGEGRKTTKGRRRRGRGGDLSKNNQSFVAFVEIRARKRLSFGGGKKIISQEFLRKTTPRTRPYSLSFAFGALMPN